MSTSSFIHIILWLLIGLICSYGLIIEQFQQTLIAQYTARVLDIALIISGLLMVVHTVAMSPLLVWLHFILEIMTIGLFDFLLTYKRKQRMLKNKFALLILFFFGVATILGLVVEYQYG